MPRPYTQTIVLLDKIFATIGLLCCLFMGLHMMLGPRLRAQMERLPRAFMRSLHRHVMWRFNTRERRRAARVEAMEAIQRARRNASDEGLWEGNVYRPKKFENPTKPH